MAPTHTFEAPHPTDIPKLAPEDDAYDTGTTEEPQYVKPEHMKVPELEPDLAPHPLGTHALGVLSIERPAEPTIEDISAARARDVLARRDEKMRLRKLTGHI